MKASFASCRSRRNTTFCSSRAYLRQKGSLPWNPKDFAVLQSNKKICGVCGGIAHYFDVDSNLIRLITAALMLAGGLSIWLYIIAAIILPETNAF